MDQRTDIGHLSQFSRGLLDLLDRVEYRRIVSSEDMEAVGRLRAQSYGRGNVLSGGAGESLVDDLDYDSHTFVVGVYSDDELISTLRVHHLTPDHRKGSSIKLFGDVLNPMLDRGMTFIDPSRFAANEAFSEEFPGLPYITLRIATMASVYFDVDHCLASVKVMHSAFYKRVFGFFEMSPARVLEDYSYPLTLLAEDTSNRVDVARRYPVFKSHPYEQRLMFDRDAAADIAPLSILPTARYADAVPVRAPISIFGA
jgi:hypothetical protein